MKRFFLLIALIALTLGYVSGKKGYKARRDFLKPLKVPLLENDLARCEGIEENPVLMLVHLNGGVKGLGRTLDSLKSQDYSNLEILFLNEEASSLVVDRVKAFLQESDLNATIVSGPRSKLSHVAKAHAKRLGDQGVVTYLKGGDWLTNSYVLKLINLKKVEESFDLLVGQYVNYPNYEQGMVSKGIRKAIEKCQLPQGKEALSSFKALSVPFALNNQSLDLLSIDQKSTFKELLSKAKKKCHFARNVFTVHNKAGEDEEVLFDQ